MLHGRGEFFGVGEGDFDGGGARVLCDEGVEGVEAVAEEEGGLALAGEGGVCGPGSDDGGEGGEFGVEGLGEGGEVELCVAEDEGDGGGFGAHGAEVAGVLEEAREEACGGECLGGEFGEFLGGGPCGEGFLAAFDAEAVAGIEAEDDIEAGEEDF